jgi:D-alanyl-D-alanine carboxypeptidase (penicillin-binding protein 5/6)
MISRCLLVFGLVLSLATPTWASVDAADRVEGAKPSATGVPTAAMPDVGMREGLLCTSDGRVLWSRHESDRRAMASITKVMTAVIVMENADTNDEVTISAAAKATKFSSPFLKVGQRITVHELLEALLVRSGNDAAVALAEHVSGSEKEFVVKMNAKAAELGLRRTHFVNSHGLDVTGHYSTAEDLAILSRYAMSKPKFREIVAQKTCTVSAAGSSEEAENTNLLIGNYDGANGVKTGWTDNAGYSVVVSAKRGNVELFAVVMGTPNEQARFRAARDLLDWGFVHYREQELAAAGTIVGAAAVADYINATVPAVVSEDTSLAVFDLAGPIRRKVKLVTVSAPVREGDRVGAVTFVQAGRLISTVPLVAGADVRAPTAIERLGIAIARAWRRLRGQPVRAVATPAG